MKILLLTPRYPYPENGGDIQRINKVAYYLKSQGHYIILLSFYETNTQIQNKLENFDKVYVVKRNKLESILNMLHFLILGKPLQCGYYYSNKYMDSLKSVMENEKPDRIIAWLLRITPYTDKLGLEEKTIVEMSDALSKTYSMSHKGKGSLIKKIAYEIERSLIEKYEKEVIHRYPKIILVSAQDIKFLHEKIGEGSNSLAFHSLGIDCMKEPVNIKDVDMNKICFVGNMRTLQNQDAVLRFVKNIFPIILKSIPTAKFYIVGAEPSAQIRHLSSDNIIVTGYVNSIKDTIKNSCVAVAPVHVAAGLQNKVLASMGCGIPVVMSTLISKAIPELEHGKNCFVCDNDMAFADTCVQIMRNPDLRDTVGRQSLNMVKRFYSWNERLSGYECFDKNKI